VQIGAANGTGGDFDDGIPPVLDLGIRDAFTADIALAMPGQRFHQSLLVVALPTNTSRKICS
jgi:hypothetical protein